MIQTFIIKTDQKSPKFLLQQDISTPLQRVWLAHLMGFSFEIEYKKGKKNIEADSLSMISNLKVLCLAMQSAGEG